MKARILVMLFTIAVLTISTGGIIGKIWNGGKKFVSNVLHGDASGGLVGNSFSPAIDKYEGANQRSIALLDKSLDDRLKQFDNIILTKEDHLNDILTKREDQLNEILTAREDQLSNIITAREDQLNDILTARENQINEIFNSSILLADEKIKEDINALDESLEFRVGQFTTGLTSTSFIFTAASWRVVKGVIQLVLIVLLVYYILRIIAESNSKNNIADKERISSRIRLFSFIVLVAILIVSFFNPITTTWINPEYNELKETYLKKVSDASSIYNYKEASYNAYLLSELDQTNGNSEYLNFKYSLLKDLAYRPKVAVFNDNTSDEIALKMRNFEILFNKSDKSDPEFYIINALFTQNAYKDKEGDAIAAYLCYYSISSRKDTAITYPLDIFAYNILKNFKSHPLSKNDVTKILQNYEVDISQVSVPDFDNLYIKDSLLTKSSNFNQNFKFNDLLQNIIQRDESNFLKYLGFEKSGNIVEQQRLGTQYIINWIHLVNSLQNLKNNNIRFSSLNINDAYVNYIINSFTSQKINFPEEYNSFSNEVEKLIDNAFYKDPNTSEIEQAKTKIKSDFSVFKRRFLCDILINFSNNPKFAIINSESRKANWWYDKTIIFANKYKSYLNNKDPLLLSNLAIISSEIGIYDYTMSNPIPLANRLNNQLVVSINKNGTPSNFNAEMLKNTS
ncbi:hypothetical protein, partial [Spirosoma koreense]